MVENYTTDRLDFKRAALLSAVREHLAGTAQPS
jgi:hypothetical protein